MKCTLCGVTCTDCESFHGRLMWDGRFATIFDMDISECESRADILLAIEKRKVSAREANEKWEREHPRGTKRPEATEGQDEG